MIAVSGVLAGLLSGALAGPARAETVTGTRSELVREQAHAIAIRIDKGSAKLVVRRTVHNGGTRHDQAMFFLDMPDGAVATGLRTLGTKDDKPFWFAGDLMEAEAAAAKYRELTGIGGYYPKDPALLSWRSQGLLALQVFPVAPQQPKTVEYTLSMPVHYAGGKYHLTLPRMGTEALSASASASPAVRGDSLFVGDKRVPPGTSFRLDKETIDIAVARRSAPTIDGGLASVQIAKDRALVQFHIEAAAKLSEVPRGAHVVVLLDASRSIRDGHEEASLAAARAYLSHFNDAKVQVVTFDREPSAVHPGFVSQRRAIADLGTRVIPRKNGSNVDRALAFADKLLSDLPAKTPRRIVLLTDLMTRSSLTPEKVKGTLKSGALLHIATVAPGEPFLRREDDDAWSGVALGTGGVLWQAQATRSDSAAEPMATVFEEWARPVRIHHLKVVMRGSQPEDLSRLPDALDEGEGIEHLAIVKEGVPHVELEGALWATPIHKSIMADEKEGDLWSALVFGSDVFSSLEESEMMPLAMRGHVVSPVTSYLAIEPGVRPSTEGLDWSGSGQGFGSGSGRLFGSSRTKAPRVSGFDPNAFLRDKLSSAWSACGGGKRAVTVTLETTLDEVVDVPSITLDAPDDAAARQCLERATWDLMLPGAFSAAWQSFTIAL